MQMSERRLEENGARMPMRRDTAMDAAIGMETPATLSFPHPCTLHSACVRRTLAVDMAPLPVCTATPVEGFGGEWSRTGRAELS